MGVGIWWAGVYTLHSTHSPTLPTYTLNTLYTLVVDVRRRVELRLDVEYTAFGWGFVYGVRAGLWAEVALQPQCRLPVNARRRVELRLEVEYPSVIHG